MPKFWNFTSEEQGVELRIDGEIMMDDDLWALLFGLEGVTPSGFRAELAQYAGKNITVWINSQGGDVYAAAQIYNSLKEHRGKVTAKIDGIAMSAASVIAMAGQETFMSPVGIIMIHNPWWGIAGDANDFRHAADVLDEVKQTIINAYQMKSGRSRQKISKLMDNETYMSAKTALSEGFIDGILYADQENAPAAIENSFMFSRAGVQNATAESTRRFLEQYTARWRAMNPITKQEPSPAYGRDFNFRVSVREKQNRRNHR